jgi:hypothetical protein
MKLAETLDVRAARVGISRSRRLQMRKMMSHSSFRLRHGDPGVIIDEYVAKVDRLRASTRLDGTAIDLSARLGEREFWRYQHLLAGGGAGPVPSPPGPSPTPPTPVPATPTGRGGPPGATPAIAPAQQHPVPEAAKHEPPGAAGLRIGGYMFGLGLLTGLGSLLLIGVGSEAGGLIGFTLAALLVAIGLLVLLISALVYAVGD